MAALTPFRTALLEAPVIATVNGSGDGAWGSWTGTATGVTTFLGSATGTWGSWTGAATGVATFNGTATGTWGSWTGTASGSGVVLGVATGAWGTWTGRAVIARIGTVTVAARGLTTRFKVRGLRT